MRKIGILGGTFDPIHLGHLQMADIAMRELGLERVIFIPCGTAYMKKNVSESRMRLEMTEVTLRDYPFYEVSDMEVRREGNSYTSQTLCELKKQYSETEIYLLIGEDHLFDIEKWYRPEVVFANSLLFCYLREAKQKAFEKADELKQLYGAQIIFAKEKVINISSSQIRDELNRQCSVKEYLEPKTWMYLQENRIYE